MVRGSLALIFTLHISRAAGISAYDPSVGTFIRLSVYLESLAGASSEKLRGHRMVGWMDRRTHVRHFCVIRCACAYYDHTQLKDTT